MEKLWLLGLNSGDIGDNIDMWMIKITIKANQIDMDVLLISKVGNIQKACLSLKSGFFPLFYWFVNFTLTDKHGTKNFWDLSALALGMWVHLGFGDSGFWGFGRFTFVSDHFL